MEKIGFWKEYRGNMVGSSIKNEYFNCKDPNYLENKTKILNYLKNGISMVAIRLLVRDIFDEKYTVGSYSNFTDGEWVWTEELIYYVEYYDLYLDYSLLKKMELVNYQYANEIDKEILKGFEKESEEELGFIIESPKILTEDERNGILSRVSRISE